MANKSDTQVKAQQTGVVSEGVENIDDIDLSTLGFKEQQTGYFPYWNPTEPGRRFMGTVIMLDDSDPTFPRYILQATKYAVTCRRGPKTDAETVIVKPGDFFTAPVHKQIPLEDYYGIEVVAMATERVDLPPAKDDPKRQPRTMWKYKLLVDEKTDAELKQKRSEMAAKTAEMRKLAMQQMRELAAKQALEDAARVAVGLPATAPAATPAS